MEMRNTVMRRLKPSRLLMLMSVPLLAACGDLLDLDINTDPNRAVEIEPDLLMPTMIANLASVRSIEISPGNAFHAQIWASNGSTGVFNDPERYSVFLWQSGLGLPDESYYREDTHAETR